MAHEITHKDAFGYVGQKAWHGLGVALREQFRTKKVRYKPVRQMTEAQRLAAAERLTAVRAKASVCAKENTDAA